MEKDNFISYLSMGQQEFSCEFDIKHEEQIEVIVDDVILEYLNDYLIENFNEKTKIVKLKEKLGSTLYPKLLILKRNPYIRRATDFSDETQIKAGLLNLGFNNVISNQQYLNEFLTQLSQGFEAKKVNDEGGEEPPPAEAGFLDPRDWSEKIHIIDLEDGFEGSEYCEIGIETPKPFTHNVYFLYAKDAGKFPNETIYRLTNFDEIKEPCSITFFVDKRICLAKTGSEFIKKTYGMLNLGGAYIEDFYIFSNTKEVMAQKMIKGVQLKKLYNSVFEELNMIDNDLLMVSEKYYMDPARGH